MDVSGNGVAFGLRVLWLGLLASAASAQVTWHVSATAAPGGDGSASAPFQTVVAALYNLALEDGDTVLVGPGTYDGGRLRAEIVLESTHGPAVTTLRAPGPSLMAVECFLADCTVRGFTVIGGSGANSIAVAISNGLLERCAILGGSPSPTGFGVRACHATIRHCSITGFQIGITPASFPCLPIVRDSIVHGNFLDLDWVDVAYSCFDVQSGSVLGPGCFSAAPAWIGGPTRDLHLTAGSPCIDAGNPSSPLDPDGSRADLGAFPFEPIYAVPQSYCTAKTNSLGCVPQIGFTGIPSVSTPAPFVVRATNELNQRAGLLFWGYAPKNIPYQGGWLCVQAPTRRSPLLNSGGPTFGNTCTGVLQLDFNTLLRSGADPLATVGTELFSQFWSRDPAASFSTNRSDALRFTVQP